MDEDKQFFISDGDDCRCFNFGEYKGKYLKRIAEDHPDYLQSILDKNEFPQCVLIEIREEMKRTEARLHAVGLIREIYRKTYGKEYEGD